VQAKRELSALRGAFAASHGRMRRTSRVLCQRSLRKLSTKNQLDRCACSGFLTVRSRAPLLARSLPDDLEFRPVIVA
jgi:hypothetical protein